MADIVHTDGGGSDGSNTVAIVAVVLLVGLAILFFMYVLPSMRQPAAPAQAPAPDGGSIEINLPEPSPEPSPEPTPEPAPAPAP